MRIGILELLTGEARRSWTDKAYALLLTSQYASVMPQAISVWCRKLGYEVFYATYWGQRPPEQLLPDDLDVVFISTYTLSSGLAYALAKLYRHRRTLTVIGGPHAKAFPDDCLRFFDLVVLECDETLLTEILADLPRGDIVSSGRTLSAVPSVVERMPEIEKSIFWRGKPYLSTTIPMLASVGCPYTCNFCIDWNNPYVLLPLDQLEEDLKFISATMPGVMLGFADPNFAVRFDQVLSVLETVPPGSRNRYIMESSLTNLRGPRLQRLRDTNCFYVAPGVESWTAYSNKSGLGAAASGRWKLWTTSWSISSSCGSTWGASRRT